MMEMCTFGLGSARVHNELWHIVPALWLNVFRVRDFGALVPVLRLDGVGVLHVNRGVRRGARSRTAGNESCPSWGSEHAKSGES
jgi:hypothetical protein